MPTFDHSDIRGLVTARPMVRRELLSLVSEIVDHLMVPQRGVVDSSNLCFVSFCMSSVGYVMDWGILLLPVTVVWLSVFCLQPFA